MRESSLVLTVLGECCKAEVALLVVQAVMVDMVNNEMVGGVDNLAVHFDAFAVLLSYGVVTFFRAFRKPGESAQARIVFGIDDGEFTPCERDPPGCAIMGVGGMRWVEILALIQRRVDRPAALGTFFLPTDQGGPAGTGGEGRKTAIITSGFGFILAHKRRYERKNKCTIRLSPPFC